jgi:hypothetical protein
MADKLFTRYIVILSHPAALPDAVEQPLVTGRNGSLAACDAPSSRVSWGRAAAWLASFTGSSRPVVDGGKRPL